MKHLILIAALVFSSVAASPPPDPESRSAAIDNYAFKPPTITVCAGHAVTWTNKDDDPHTVTATDGAFDSKGLGQGDTFKRTFDKAGTYAYFCKAHPYMKGTVIVKECGQ